MIPKVIHQIWLSENSQIPIQYVEMSKTWKQFNPDFDYILWGENIYSEFGGKDFLFNKYRLNGVHPAQVSDILRLLLLQKYGGFYTDIDTECFQSILPLFKNDLICYIYGYMSDKILVSFESFGSIPNHRLVNLVLEKIKDNIDMPNINLLWKFGFKLWQNAIILEASHDMTIYGPNIAKQYFKHHFYNSWIEKDKINFYPSLS